MHQTYCQRQFLCVQGINKSSRLLSRKSFNTLKKKSSKSYVNVDWVLILTMTIYVFRHHYFLNSLAPGCAR